MSDNYDMNFADIQAVALSVLTDFRVLLCAVFVVLYLRFIYYVVGYRKKVPKPAKKKYPVVSNAPQEEQNAEQSTDDTSDSDDVIV